MARVMTAKTKNFVSPAMMILFKTKNPLFLHDDYPEVPFSVRNFVRDQDAFYSAYFPMHDQRKRNSR